jgi:hypothetical protein
MRGGFAPARLISRVSRHHLKPRKKTSTYGKTSTYSKKKSSDRSSLPRY